MYLFITTILFIEQYQFFRTTEENTTEENSTSEAETFLLNIYQTVGESVAFLSSLLDIPVKNKTTTVTTTSAPQEISQRGAKYLKHPNQL